MAKPASTKKTVRKRAVDEDEYEDDSALLRKLKADPIYLRAVKKLDGMMRMMNPVDLCDELQTLHAARGIRTLSVKKILSNQVTQMIEADLQNSAYRSRTIEIKMRCVRTSYQFTETFGVLKKYIMSNYDKLIRSAVGNTAQDRNNYVDSQFIMYSQYSNELDMLFDLCEVVLADYDAAGWSLNRIQKTLDAVAKDRG